MAAYAHTPLLSRLDAHVRDCIARNDCDALRTIFRHAASFAIHSVHAQVPQHEGGYAKWLIDGNAHHRYFHATQRALDDMEVLANLLTVDDFRRDKWDFCELIRANIRGLGFAKAAFCAALCGFDVPCVDIHALCDGYGLSKDAAEKWRGAWRKWEHYRKDCYALFRESRNAQWDRFAEWVPRFTQSSHAVYFNSLGV